MTTKKTKKAARSEPRDGFVLGRFHPNFVVGMIAKAATEAPVTLDKMTKKFGDLLKTPSHVEDRFKWAFTEAKRLGFKVIHNDAKDSWRIIEKS